MRIVRLEAENVKRLKAVAINPTGAVIKVAGKNKQGKTSLLDAIEALFAGKDAQQPKMIRKGEEKARVVAELGDLVVERTWTSKGTYLKVRSKYGAVYPSPQAILDKFTNELAFDPVAFLREKPARQLEVVRQLVGIDTSKIDGERQGAYDQRTHVNRDAAAAKVRLDGLPEVQAPDEEVSIQDLLQERQLMQELKAENDRRRGKVEDAKRVVAINERGHAEVLQRIERLRKELEFAEKSARGSKLSLDEAKAAHAAAEQSAANLVDPDFAVVDQELRDVEETNRRVRSKKARAVAVAEHLKLSGQSAGLTDRIDALDAQRQKLIAEAPFPVAGLGFGEDGLTYQGIPFEQSSAAEQLIVSLAMAKAKNPKLRVFLIRDASLLDEDSMAELERFCEANDMQAWLEVVGKPEDAAVVIEDGESSGPQAVEPVASSDEQPGASA